MPRILVTDGDERSALAVTRSLIAAGHEVTVGSRSGRSLAGGARRASEIGLPDPARDPAGFADAVLVAVDALHVDVLLPITEASLLAVLPRRLDLGSTRLPFVDQDRFNAVCDKGAVFVAAREIGIAVPADTTLTAPPTGAAGAVTDRFPVVVKPSRSVVGGPSSRQRLSVSHAADAPALDARLRALPDEAFPVHLQQRIEGDGIGVFVLMWNGELVARFAHRRLREKPPAGGVSVYRESVALDPELERQSLRLLEAFGWEGVAMVEYKLDRSGTPYLMEINGRFWGSLQLAIDAGVDFPRLLVDAALDRPPAAPPAYRAGVRTRWLWGDIDHLLQRWFRSREALDLPADAPGRLAATWQFLRSFLEGRSEVFRVRDPLPAWRETVRWFADLRPFGGSA